MRCLVCLPLLGLLACADVEDPGSEGGEAHGLVTTVELVFTDVSGTWEDRSFRWSDPEDDGNPLVDPVVLVEGVEYALEVRFTNELEDPAEDVTAEVEEEGEEHQVFLTGSGVQSEATGANPAALLDVAYADTDASGLPLGLAHDATALAVGTRELIVTLQHLPEEDGSALKVEGLADDVAAEGFGAIPGDTDVQVRFDLTVEAL